MKKESEMAKTIREWEELIAKEKKVKSQVNSQWTGDMIMFAVAMFVMYGIFWITGLV